jgi:hypothetical protein
MTPASSSATSPAAAAARSRRLRHIREDLAARLWQVWLETPEGRRYADVPAAGEPALAARGWKYVAEQVRAMARAIEGEGEPTK